MTEMYEVRQAGKIVGTIRKSDLTNMGDLLIRARYEVAAMVGGSMGRAILNGKVSQYTTGEIILSPRISRGRRSVDARGNLRYYFLVPYIFEGKREI